MFCHPVSGNPS